jgi:hypothetical protein
MLMMPMLIMLLCGAAVVLCHAGTALLYALCGCCTALLYYAGATRRYYFGPIG